MPRLSDEVSLFEDSLENESDIEVEEKKYKSVRINRRKRYAEISNQSEPCLSKEASNNNQFENAQNFSESDINVSPRQNKKKKKTKDGEEECSSEEERWLDAIESGKLDEIDEELKKIKHKDPKLMTARQRAMLDRKTEKDPFAEELVSLPNGYREKIVTPQMLQDKAKKSARRRQLADEKREKNKKKTMERLLKKSDSKCVKLGQKRGSKKTVPCITYTNNGQLITISLPPDVPFPLSETNVKPCKPQLCARKGCMNLKRYSCSKTKVPLCSLECYKQY